MPRDCRNYRDQISKGLLGELSPDEQQALETHLAECTPCARERDLYAGTFNLLHNMKDLPVPRHFLIYPEEQRLSPWRLFQQVSLPWKAAVAAALLLMLSLSGFVLANLELTAELGSYTLRLGKPQPLRVEPPTPSANREAIEQRLIRVVEERSKKQNLELLRTLRTEISGSQAALTRDQRRMLQTVLAALEGRLNDRIISTATTLETGTSRSLDSLYRTLEAQRQADLAAINDRISRVSFSTELKSNQTDAILVTLLEAAELKLR